MQLSINGLIRPLNLKNFLENTWVFFVLFQRRFKTQVGEQNLESLFRTTKLTETR